MAGISRELTLVDKFSSIWDKFTHKAEKAEKAVEKISGDAVTRAMEGLAAKANKNIDYLEAMQKAYRDLVAEYGIGSVKAEEVLDVIKNKFVELGATLSDSLERKDFGTMLELYDITRAVDKGWIKFQGHIRGASDEIAAFRANTEEAYDATDAWWESVERMQSIFDGPNEQLDAMLRATDQIASKFGETSEEGKAAFTELQDSVRLFSDEWLSKMDLADSKTKSLLDKVLMLSSQDMIKLPDEVIQKLEEARAKAEAFGNANKKAAKDSEKHYGKLGKTLGRLGVMLFGLRKIVSAVKNAMSRVPDEIMKPFNKLKQLLSDDLARVTSSLFQGLQKGLERVNQLFESPAGRNFVAALQVGFEAVGAVIGFVIEKIADLAEFLGRQLENAQIDFEAAGEVIGYIVGSLYVVIHNVIATIWNVVASFAEFLGNVFTDPLGSVVRLVVDVANIIVDIIAWAARQIDKLLGTNFAGAITDFQDEINTRVAEKFGVKKFELERMDILEGSDVLEKFAAVGAGYGRKMESALKGGVALNDIKASSAQTAGNTKAIKDALTDEDLKMLIDVATQKFVSNVNLTAQTPVINITGQNTGNTAADRRALANDIKFILMEQLASGATSSEYAYAGA